MYSCIEVDEIDIDIDILCIIGASLLCTRCKNVPKGNVSV